MDARITLFYLVATAGLAMMVGSLWLIAKEKIFIDRETNRPIEIDLKWLGRFKANAPALALFMLASLLLIYPLVRVNTLTRYVEVDTVPVKGLVEADAYPVIVYAVRRGEILHSNGDFSMPVSFLGDTDIDDYRILLIVNGRVMEEASAVRQERGKPIQVSFRKVVVEPPLYEARVSPIPAAYK
jgi:hypothetical protein